MNKTLIIFTLFLSSNYVHAGLIFVASIPVKCKETKSILSKVIVPDDFRLNPYQALKKVIELQPRIKLCASKLKQVIYRDNVNYYFTNDQLFLDKSRLPEKYVVVNARTGKVDDKF